MNITILANKDLAANYALNLLLPKLADHQLRLFLSTRVGSANQQKPDAIVEMAEQERQLLHTLDASDKGLLGFDALNQYLHSPSTMLDNINKPQGLAQLRQTQPDLVISIRFGKILKSSAIAVAKHGVINLHSGILPDYRGVMATFWAMLYGEEQIGSTLHFIPDSGIDNGDIISQSRISLNKNKSYQWHVLTLYQQGCEMIADAVNRLASGEKLVCHTQAAKGAYYSYPDQTDMDIFSQKGLKLMDIKEVEGIIG